MAPIQIARLRGRSRTSSTRAMGNGDQGAAAGFIAMANAEAPLLDTSARAEMPGVGDAHSEGSAKAYSEQVQDLQDLPRWHADRLARGW